MILPPHLIPVAVNRCTYQPRTTRCVRAHHPEHPNAHIRVHAPIDDHGEGGQQ